MKIKSVLKNKRILLTVSVCIISVLVIAGVIGLNGLYLKNGPSAFGITVNGGQTTSFYLNEKDGVYYAFLPSYTSIEGSTFALNSGAVLSFDGKKAGNGTTLKGIVPDSTYNFSLNSKGNKTEGSFVIKISENLPAIFIDTKSGSMEKVNSDKSYCEQGTVRVINSDGSENYSGILEYIRGRGNSSWSVPKKPYQIKLDNSGDLLDMGSAKNWILTANYNDYSNLRNKIVFDCADYIGLEYTPDSRFADLYLNGEYAGLYLLSEKIEIGKTRVDITDLGEKNSAVNTNNPENYKDFKETTEKNAVKKGKALPNSPSDISGGYLLELDISERFNEKSGGYITERGQVVAIKEPDYPSREEVDYISEILQEFEDAIYADDGICPSTGKSFSEYIDLESWVKKYLIEEVFLNMDSGITSQYFYKDAGNDKLYAGPVWDYDWSMGNSGFSNTIFANKVYRGGEIYNRWFSALYSQPEFYSDFVKCYNENLLPYLKGLIDGGLDTYRKEIQASADMDKIRWDKSEENILNDSVALDNFITERENFLTDLWVNKSEYCEVMAFVESGYGRICFFSVKKGEKIKPEIYEILKNFKWFSKDTDEPFDLLSTISNDIVIYAKVKE